MDILTNDKRILQAEYTENVIKRINELCLNELCTFDARREATKKILAIKALIPIYINSLILLIPLYEKKSLYQMWINYFTVKGFYNEEEKTKVFFENGNSILLEMPYQVFLKRFQKADAIKKYMKRNNV